MEPQVHHQTRLPPIQFHQAVASSVPPAAQQNIQQQPQNHNQTRHQQNIQSHLSKSLFNSASATSSKIPANQHQANTYFDNRSNQCYNYSSMNNDNNVNNNNIGNINNGNINNYTNNNSNDNSNNATNNSNVRNGINGGSNGDVSMSGVTSVYVPGTGSGLPQMGGIMTTATNGTSIISVTVNNQSGRSTGVHFEHEDTNGCNFNDKTGVSTGWVCWLVDQVGLLVH